MKKRSRVRGKGRCKIVKESLKGTERGVSGDAYSKPKKKSPIRGKGAGGRGEGGGGDSSLGCGGALRQY